MNTLQNIAISGAGIMGLMTAYWLQQALPDITLTIFDKAPYPWNNASSKAGGMLAPYAELDHMPHSYLPAAKHSIGIWESIEKELNADFEFRQKGSLILAHPEDRHLLSRFGAILPKDKSWNAVQTDDIRELEPDLDVKTFTNGLFLPEEAHLHPRKAMDALRKDLPEIVQGDASPEQLSGEYDLVIDCRGMGAQSDHTDLRGVKGEVLIVHNPDFILHRPLRLMHPRYPLYIVPREGNVFMIGATIIESAENETVSMRSAMELQSALYSIHPSFAESEIIEMSAGIRPALPNNLPLISIKNNTIHCNGLFRHGFLLSPVMAECVIDYVTGNENIYSDLFIKEHTNENSTERQALRA